MKKSPSVQERIRFWQKKLQGYEKKYNELRRQSPGRWWHDEFFNNQMQVLESSIISTKKRIAELKAKA